MVRVGSRDSELALRQTAWVVSRLAQAYPHLDFSVRGIKTKGDKMLHLRLPDIGGKGLFVKELERALLRGQIDLAVHSLKDLPTEIPKGLTLGAITSREDYRDVLVSRGGETLAGLAPGTRVGTSSTRRVAQLKARRPDLCWEPLRGNLGTRLRRLDEGHVDAIVVAAAGVLRMGWPERIAEYLAPSVCLPAVGQGALAVEVRAGDEDVLALVRTVHHVPTAVAVTAERSFLAALGGGCQVPIAALGELRGGVLCLRGLVASPDGSRLVADMIEGAAEEASELGNALARTLLARGAGEILARADAGGQGGRP